MRLKVLGDLFGDLAGKKAPIARFSATVRRAKMRCPSGTCCRPIVAISWGGTSRRLAPAKRMSPTRGRRSPPTAFKAVVLPALFAPTSVTICLFSTLIETPLRCAGCCRKRHECRRSREEPCRLATHLGWGVWEIGCVPRSPAVEQLWGRPDRPRSPSRRSGPRRAAPRRS